MEKQVKKKKRRQIEVNGVVINNAENKKTAGDVKNKEPVSFENYVENINDMLK